MSVWAGSGNTLQELFLLPPFSASLCGLCGLLFPLGGGGLGWVALLCPLRLTGAFQGVCRFPAYGVIKLIGPLLFQARFGLHSL